MNFAKELGGLLFDPRGRISRQDMLVAATFTVVLDMGLASLASGPEFYLLKALAYWVGGVGIIKRLHDTGNSGWWFLGGAGGLCIWATILGLGIGFTVGLEALQPGSLGYIALVGALMLPALGATLWLHFAAGEPGMNRYGAEPAGILGKMAGEVPVEGATSSR